MHPFTLNSTYLLNQKESSAPVPRTYLTKYSSAPSYSSNPAYLLNQNILAHPFSVEFRVPTRPKHLSVPFFRQIPRTYSTKNSSDQQPTSFISDTRIRIHLLNRNHVLPWTLSKNIEPRLRNGESSPKRYLNIALQKR